MNALDPTLFSEPLDCLPCCGPTCDCALYIGQLPLTVPPTPYGNYATAATAITDQTDGCIAFADFGGGDTALSIVASFDGTTITAVAHTEVMAPSLALRVDTYFSLSLLSGAVLTIPFVLTTGGTPSATVELWDCATGATVDTDSSSSSSGTLTLTAPASGIYILFVRGLGTLGIVTSTDMDFSVTCDMTYWVNPVIALWDDGGTTRKLWACPKLFLPPLTENTGDWYADATAAAAAITNQTSNCVGYSDYLNGPASFTATDLGTSLKLDETYASGVFTSDGMWGGLNAVNGQTMTFTTTIIFGTASVSWAIYDDVGFLVEASGGAVASPSTSSALPYKGRYTVEVSAGSSSTNTDLAVTVSSSGTLSVNQITALYDLGLSCPANLDC